MVCAQSVVIGSEGCGILWNCLGLMDKVARLWPMTEAVPEGRGWTGGRGYAERWALSSTRDSIRGHLSPVYIHERKALSDHTVGISDEA